MHAMNDLQLEMLRAQSDYRHARVDHDYRRSAHRRSPWWRVRAHRQARVDPES